MFIFASKNPIKTTVYSQRNQTYSSHKVIKDKIQNEPSFESVRKTYIVAYEM